MQKSFLTGKLVRICSALSALALVLMMSVTVVDVLMANLFRHPIVGVFDLVETTLVLVVFLGFPATFLANSHIAVDVIDLVTSPANVARLKIVAKLLTFVFLIFLAWQMINPAHDAFKFGERKQELGLPLYILWIPMIFGIAVSALMVFLSLFERETSSAADKE